jgi:hypothetical protein
MKLPVNPPAPPPALACARLIKYALLDKSVGYAGRTLLFVDGKELGRVPRLAICADKKPPGVLLFHCNRKWDVLGCSAHSSMSEAKQSAESIYPGLSPRWVNPRVTKKQSERYLDKLFSGQRCSFCNKRPDHVQQLIRKDNVTICNHCIDEFYNSLHAPH